MEGAQPVRRLSSINSLSSISHSVGPVMKKTSKGFSSEIRDLTF